MGWTEPRDWTVGEVVTEAMMDTHIKNNLRYLKGLDGAVTLSDALILPDGAGYYLHIPILTTTQRDLLTATAGMLIYNSTTTQFNKYENGAWRADLGFNSHHGDLSGMTDDDHTQYQKENLLTTPGDLPYATGTSVWVRLGIGTANQILRTNVGTTAPEWASLGIVATETLQFSNNTEQETLSATYVKLKETKLDVGLTGFQTIRIKFDLRSGSEGYPVYGKIYRNGVAIGTERTATTITGSTFTEDFNCSAWATNDLIQIYAYAPAGAYLAYVNDFRFYYALYYAMTSQDP